MLYLADTAKIEELEDLYRYFPLQGVTTNPTILKNSGMKLTSAMGKIQKIVGDGMIHVQVMSEKAEDMCAEARKYKEYFGIGDNYFAKIPVTPDGYKAMQILSAEGMGVTATAIFTQQQALVAARSGADFVAPYVSRLDNISSHGIQVVAGTHASTINHEILTKLIQHPMTDISVKQFLEDGKDIYDINIQSIQVQ